MAAVAQGEQRGSARVVGGLCAAGWAAVRKIANSTNLGAAGRAFHGAGGGVGEGARGRTGIGQVARFKREGLAGEGVFPFAFTGTGIYSGMIGKHS